MEQTVKGINIYEEEIEIPKEKLFFRPSCYALIIKDSELLVITNRSSGKLFFPGGGVDLGETLEQGLRREVKEEVGLDVQDSKLFDFNELFFEYPPTQESFHSLQFYYLCSAKNFKLLAEDQINDSEASKPTWLPIKDLIVEDFQNCGSGFIERLLIKLKDL